MSETHPRLVLVNDNMRYRFGTWLRRYGFDVVECATGQEALDVVDGNCELAILDVNLPDMTGYEVCERIKQNPVTSAVAVLHVSATAIATPERAMGLRRGADGYLTEPLERDELISTVEAMLRLARARKQAQTLASRLGWLHDTTLRFNALTDIPALVSAAAVAAAELTGAVAAACVSTETGGVVASASPGADGLSTALDETGIARIETSSQAVLGAAFPTMSLDDNALLRCTSGQGLGRGARMFTTAAPGSDSELTDKLLDQLTNALGVAADNLRLLARERTTTTTLQENLARANVLARAGEILDSSLDYVQTLQSIARLLAPDVADWCSISVLNDRGQMYRVAVFHPSADKNTLAQELLGTEELPVTGALGPGTAILTGTTQSLEVVTEEMLRNSAIDIRSREIAGELGVGALISVPLVARGQVLGAITLVNEHTLSFHTEDVQLAEELARRAAMSIDNARLYSERGRIAHTLQAGLLPTSLPDIPGVELVGRYHPAGEFNEVGGDFYDVYLRSEGEWLVAIGDVTGKGASAAVTTALVRYTLRSSALRPGTSTDLLRHLNRAMLSQKSNGCTVALLSVRPQADGTCLFSVSLAGHPAPLLIRSDGEAATIGTYGTLLGLREEVEFTETAVTLASGDVLLLYTDGLTESSRPGVTDEQLLEHVCAAPRGGLAALLDHLEALAMSDEHSLRDDIALLALRATPASH